jgi:hypothetical protein
MPSHDDSQAMSKLLPFDRLQRMLKVQPRKRTALPHGSFVMTATAENTKPSTSTELAIDVQKLAREMDRYDAEVRERRRRAALQAIDDELPKIRAEREGEQ